jgi:NTE family protein
MSNQLPPETNGKELTPPLTTNLVQNSVPASGAKRRLFVAFEGGGAKALVHIGALKALETREFEFKGVAGTSAGAIVAALKAAGFVADEIVDPVSRRTILDTYAELTQQRMTPTGFFGSGGWSKVKLVRAVCKNWAAICFVIAVILFGAFLGTALEYGALQGLSIAGEIFSVIVIISIVLTFLLFRHFGIASAQTFRNVVNKLICHKLFPGQPERCVTMGDLNGNGRPVLRIVAANITGHRLRLFSSDADTDQGLAVADVVTASVCIPLIFRPWLIGGSHHVDGGIVSNLPAWPFDEERELDVDATTDAFEIRQPLTARESGGVRQWLLDVAMTAMFGASILTS